MPPEQKQNPTPQSPQETRRPAIRTMRSDVEGLFKNHKPTLMQMIGAQAQEPARAGEASPARSKIPAVGIAGAALVLLLVGGGAWWYLNRGAALTATPRAGTANPRAIPRGAPQALFATESSRTITIKKQDRGQFLRLMEDSWKEEEREGTVKRVIVLLQDGPQEYPATLADFFALWRIAPPSSLTERLDQNLMVFLYRGKTGNRLGLAVRTREPERTFADMLSWEPAMLASMTQLFFDERAEAIATPFEDRTYRNIDWRYLKLSQERDLGIGYAVFPAGNVFILTTGKEPMETVINRLFDAR
ncbi:MAG: hypothetical protein AAB533_01865 [Patescibacteria group bacterium]